MIPNIPCLNKNKLEQKEKYQKACPIIVKNEE
jgi:hypothetical protein